ITGFGTGDFTLDPGFSSLAGYTPTATSFDFTASSGDFNVSGTLSTATAASASGNIYLTATVSSYSFDSSVFYIDLFDTDFDSVSFQGSWAQFSVGAEHEYTLTYVSTSLTGGGTFTGDVVAV